MKMKIQILLIISFSYLAYSSIKEYFQGVEDNHPEGYIFLFGVINIFLSLIFIKKYLKNPSNKKNW